MCGLMHLPSEQSCCWVTALGGGGGDNVAPNFLLPGWSVELGHRWVQPRQEAAVQEGRREGNVWATLWQNWRQDLAVQDADFRVLGGQGSISRGSW